MDLSPFKDHDMTEEQSQQHEIAKKHRDLQVLAAIVEGSDDAIISKDLNGIIASWNKGAQRIFGYRAQEVIGKAVNILIPDDRQNEEPEIIKRIMRGEHIDHFDTVRQRKDGSLVDVSLTISPIRNEQGVVIGASKIGRDITQRKKNEENLKQLAIELEERVAKRTQLLEDQTERLRQLAVELTEVEQKERRRLAEVLHDHLQQYLVAAKMRLDLIERKSVGIDKTGFQEARLYIDQAVEASRQLTAELRPPVLYEGGLMAGLRYLSKRMKDQHKLYVDLSVFGDIEPGSDLIKVMIYQCVQELLFNAVKYAHVSECFVTVARLEHIIRVTVMDKGSGFDMANLGINNKGSFGLFSIRERIKALGGELIIDSAPDKGATFTMMVPDKLDAPIEEGRLILQEKAYIREESSKDSIIVLVADDHAIIRQSIASLLLLQPFIKEVIEANNGEEAIRKEEALNPDIILMDINMPVMKGVEATQILHSRNPHIKIVGLSVQAEDEMAQAMKDVGAIAYFNKGDNTNTLIETIKKLAC